MLKPPRRLLLLSLIVTLAFSAAACQRPAASATENRQTAATPAVPPPPPEPTFDKDLTDTARALGGLAPLGSPTVSAVVSGTAWRQWIEGFDAKWQEATAVRHQAITTWREQELTPLVGSCETLMYPFAGPDALNAVLFFPTCQRYVMFGLEPPGSMPALDRLPPDRTARLFDETRRALNDLLQRNYFITSRMTQDTTGRELRGTVPLMALFLARLDARIVSIRTMEVGVDGQLREQTGQRPSPGAAAAAEIVFVRPGQAPQRIEYFKAPIQDEKLPEHPGLIAYLKQFAPYPVFLKSASYLLHGAEFSVLRKALLEGSRLVLQDDTGFPVRYLKAPQWQVTLYGRYTKPVKDFNYGYQKDLAASYAAGQEVKPLPFAYGYHWRDGYSAVQIAVRQPGHAEPPRDTPHK